VSRPRGARLGRMCGRRRPCRTRTGRRRAWAFSGHPACFGGHLSRLTNRSAPSRSRSIDARSRPARHRSSADARAAPIGSSNGELEEPATHAASDTVTPAPPSGSLWRVSRLPPTCIASPRNSVGTARNFTLARPIALVRVPLLARRGPRISRGFFVFSRSGVRPLRPPWDLFGTSLGPGCEPPKLVEHVAVEVVVHGAAWRGSHVSRGNGMAHPRTGWPRQRALCPAGWSRCVVLAVARQIFDLVRSGRPPLYSHRRNELAFSNPATVCRRAA
jgi:hypothetical protein